MTSKDERVKELLHRILWQVRSDPEYIKNHGHIAQSVQLSGDDWVFLESALMPAVETPALTATDYEEVLASHRRLVRELDVLLNGEAGAAKQASLCDIVGQLRKAAECRPVDLPAGKHDFHKGQCGRCGATEKVSGDECQHDLLKPNTTIEVIDKWKAKCKVCIEFFDLPGRPESPRSAP